MPISFSRSLCQSHGAIRGVAALAIFLYSATSFGAESMVDVSHAGNPYPFTLQTSVATRHFHPSSTQNNHQELLNLEWNYKDNLLVGAASFRNTYRQATQLVYWGAKFHPVDAVPDGYVKVVAGLIHGYKGEYRDRIPFNQLGTAPAILPAVGYCYKQLCSELIVFGTAGAMVTAGARF